MAEETKEQNRVSNSPPVQTAPDQVASQREETKDANTQAEGPFLEYERLLMQDLSHDPNQQQAEGAQQSNQCFTVVAKGFSVPKLVAGLLYEKYSVPQDSSLKVCSPFLIFILNFDEVDHKALELNMKWLEAHDRRPQRQAIKLTMLTQKDLVKRGDLYLKGGVFVVTYKQLVLDLLSKKVSPLIITGLIINQAHWCTTTCRESFLATIIRRQNPKSFIKCFSDRPQQARRGGLSKLEQVMRALHTNKLLLLPRILQAVRRTLDEQPNLQVCELPVRFTQTMKQMHGLLIRILQACLDQILIQYQWHVNRLEKMRASHRKAGSQTSGNPAQTQQHTLTDSLAQLTDQDQKSAIRDLLTVESALLSTFDSECRHLLGPTLPQLGIKTRAMLKNIGDIKRLIYALLNSDCIAFLSQLNDLRSFESLSNDDQYGLNNFSVFRMCDTETNRLIVALAKLAKGRIYDVVDRAKPQDSMMADAEPGSAGLAGSKRGRVTGLQKGSLLEKQYGHLNQGSHWLNKWLVFADKVCTKQRGLTRIETEKDLDVTFEVNPKLQALTEILDGLRTPKQPSSKSKKVKGSPRNEPVKPLKDEASEDVTSMRKVILIAVKTPKSCLDIQKFLVAKYIKKNHKLFYEDKLRFILSSHREFTKRQDLLIRRFGVGSKDQAKPSDESVEAFFLHKLSLLLDQKGERMWKQDRVISKHMENRERASKQKLESPLEAATPEVDVVQMISHDLSLQAPADSRFLFEFPSETLLDSEYSVRVENFGSANETFDIALKTLQPDKVVLFEPTLEFMRALEIYNAERTLIGLGKKAIDVLVIRYEESTEMYQHMSIIEQEKRSFVDLINIKSRLHVNLRDFQLEEQQNWIGKQIQQQKNGRKGDAQQPMKSKATFDGFDSMETDDRDIVVVDTREFSCTTPIFLHEMNFWIVPMVLTVGDYIFSDQICVERKAVSTGDLFTSFQSGRLLQQVTNMERYFEKPILLIEFDESIQFKLQDPYIQGGLHVGSGPARSYAGGEIHPAHIISKLALLTIHFKKLQIIWSRSPRHTAEIFRSLKDLPQNKNSDPDLQKIARTGKLGDQNEQSGEEEDDEDFKRFMPTEFLKRIPGMDSHRLNDLLRKGKQFGIRTIVDLCKTDEETLTNVLGRKCATEILEFLNRKVDFEELNKL